MSDPHATLEASPTRRYFAVGAQILLGVMLLYLAVTVPGTALSRAILAMIGFGAIWMTIRLWTATARQLILTDEGIRDDEGRWIARLDEIVEVERSPFAFKPSNGFALVLRDKGPRVWEPGLWWRLGRRVAIGGVTPAAQGKFMADTIKLMLIERDGGL